MSFKMRIPWWLDRNFSFVVILTRVWSTLFCCQLISRQKGKEIKTNIQPFPADEGTDEPEHLDAIQSCLFISTLNNHVHSWICLQIQSFNYCPTWSLWYIHPENALEVTCSADMSSAASRLHFHLWLKPFTSWFHALVISGFCHCLGHMVIIGESRLCSDRRQFDSKQTPNNLGVSASLNGKKSFAARTVGYTKKM